MQNGPAFAAIRLPMIVRFVTAWKPAEDQTDRSILLSWTATSVESVTMRAAEFDSNSRMIGGNIISRHVRRIDDDQLPDVRTLDDEAGFLLEISNRLAVHEVVSGYRMRRPRRNRRTQDDEAVVIERVAAERGVQTFCQPQARPIP